MTVKKETLKRTLNDLETRFRTQFLDNPSVKDPNANENWEEIAKARKGFEIPTFKIPMFIITMNQNTNKPFQNTNRAFENTNGPFQNTNGPFQNTNGPFQNTNRPFQNTN